MSTATLSPALMFALRADADELLLAVLAGCREHPDRQEHRPPGDARRQVPAVGADDAADVAAVTDLVTRREVLADAVPDQAHVAEVRPHPELDRVVAGEQLPPELRVRKRDARVHEADPDVPVARLGQCACRAPTRS